MNRPFIFSAFDTKTLTADAATEVSFNLSKLPLKREGQWAHLRAVILCFTLNIVQAASTGAAVKIVDLYRLVQAAVLKRNGNLGRMRFKTGHQIRIFNAIMNGGTWRDYKPASDIAANGGGSPVTTSVTFYLPLYLDAPCLEDPNSLLYPCAAYVNGSFDFNVGAVSSVLGATISLSGTNTVKLYADLVTRDELQAGVDLEVFNKSNSATSGSTTTAIDPGAYVLMALACEKTGTTTGGDDHGLFSDVSSLNYFPERFPSATGTFLLHRYMQQKTTDWTRNYGSNALPLIYPAGSDGGGARLTHNVLNRRETTAFDISTTLSSSLSLGIEFLLGRVNQHDPAHLADILNVCEVPQTAGRWVPKGSSGRAPKAERTPYVPMVFLPSGAASA